MITFLTLVAALGAAALFFHALASVDNKRMDKKEALRKKDRNGEYGDPKKVYGGNWDPNLPRPRICPVCGRLLEKHEYLYAVLFEPASPGVKRQARIYGCRYCYLGLDDSSPVKEEIGKDSPSPRPIQDEELGL
ncbi:hypothetical protein LEP1GSC058_3065 [Leptospira fainei serovar Hurstbridge str. BUT 6]|uniref:Lipoprotein n=1 Tax=Leptospira fainei serovar Hurstbridge str. BUT 6 TaxID=1193011 RepID=S3V068_9LEPT|nr:hypothetical protein [Leptospira fainei]EPG73989.1 hypothetical protein LEP1GSC058_3065 [Leptospira fainei serovar Hurstbridge str. BUT 6]